MDLTRAISYRGYSFNDAVQVEEGKSALIGCMVDRVEYGDLEVSGYTEKRSLDDGFDASDVYLGRRRVTLIGHVFGATKGELFDRLREMRYAINPRLAYDESPGDRGYLPLRYSEPTAEEATYADGVIDLELRCRSIGGVRTPFDRDSQGGSDSEAASAPFTVTFEAVDPRVYRQSRNEHALAGGAGTLTLINRGGHPAPLNIILVRGDAVTQDATFSLNVGGTPVDITVPKGTGTRIVRFDGNKKIVSYQEGDTVEVLRMNLIAPDQEWPTLGRGETDATWTFTRNVDAIAGVLLANSLIWYRETFS